MRRLAHNNSVCSAATRSAQLAASRRRCVWRHLAARWQTAARHARNLCIMALKRQTRFRGNVRGGASKHQTLNNNQRRARRQNIIAHRGITSRARHHSTHALLRHNACIALA